MASIMTHAERTTEWGDVLFGGDQNARNAGNLETLALAGKEAQNSGDGRRANDLPHFGHGVCGDMLAGTVRKAAGITVRAWLSLYFRLRISGQQHIPEKESCVLVSNHSSHVDALCLMAALPLSRLANAHPLAASDYFFASPFAGMMSNLFLNALPFGRRKNIRSSLTRCRELLKQDGRTLILFPEGTRSCDGAVGEFKPGIGQLVAGTLVRVLPCFMEGAGRAWGKGMWFPRPTALRLRIGQAMRFDHFSRSHDSFHEIAGRVRHRVMELGKTNEPAAQNALLAGELS